MYAVVIVVPSLMRFIHTCMDSHITYTFIFLTIPSLIAVDNSPDKKMTEYLYVLVLRMTKTKYCKL